MYYDRFDILSAHYTFCMDWHNGQRCPLYSRMCRIGRLVKFSPLFRGFDSLSENAQVIYNNLVEKHNLGPVNWADALEMVG